MTTSSTLFYSLLLDHLAYLAPAGSRGFRGGCRWLLLGDLVTQQMVVTKYGTGGTIINLHDYKKLLAFSPQPPLSHYSQRNNGKSRYSNAQLPPPPLARCGRDFRQLELHHTKMITRMPQKIAKTENIYRLFFFIISSLLIHSLTQYVQYSMIDSKQNSFSFITSSFLEVFFFDY